MLGSCLLDTHNVRKVLYGPNDEGRWKVEIIYEGSMKDEPATKTYGSRSQMHE